jgi:glutamate formiminotransferase/formiminotetrahydrofolate cyclodeaminase
MPKTTEDEKTARRNAIEAATKGATEVPLRVMETALASMAVIRAMAEVGQESSASDAGVGALCARAAVRGAFLNVQINAKQLKDRAFAEDVAARGAMMVAEAERLEAETLALVHSRM